MTCPHCNGAKAVSGFGCGPRVNFKPMTIPCFLCRGTGSVPDDFPERKAAADRLHAQRGKAEPYRSLRDVADALGVKPSTVSAWEHGREAPTPEALEFYARLAGERA